ncbi:hypothetical protein WN48_10310 [Eufriesea mexicana]|uniref:Uncharacterized protein n=1 Tax=Eufriesea mexicana TaxID=516756 RepID=A0A310SSK0_9HYME|nr:PREDICTED: probable serine/threonine-protein kinase clkA [Eufriesea mexicana]OAD58765.1 hypothetical protein WN48_10310 [Eufriesea mexicana]
MTKGKKESKLATQINEDKNNKTLKNNSLNTEKKKDNLSKYCKKMNVKQKIKQKDVKKCEKVTKKLSVIDMLLKYNEEKYKYQIQQLNVLFGQSVKYPTLTKDELCMLFAKYRSDGHYKTNKNLPPFTSLLVNTHNMFNEKIHVYDQFSDLQKMKFKNTEDTVANLNCNTLNENQHIEENPKVHEILQTNVKQDLLRCRQISQVNGMNNKVQNKYLYNDQSIPTINENNNHMFMNYNIKSHNNFNMFNDAQNLIQLKSDSNSNAKKISDGEEKYFLYKSINTQNVISEEQQSYRYVNKNLLYNVSDPNTQYENVTNNSEISQINDINCSVKYDNFSLNSNFYSDLYLNKCNNMTSINNNNNYQSMTSAQSIYIPPNLESCSNVKNSVPSYQLSLIKNCSEQDNLNLSIDTDMYSVMNNKNLTHISNDNGNNTQANLDAYNANSTMIPGDIFSEMDTFIPSCPGIIDQHN